MPTVRQTIIDLLNASPMNARELSQRVGIQETEVTDHLAHIARSLEAKEKKLVIQPAVCLLCGYVFKGRKRYTRPGRCPSCKKSHIQSARFRVD
ncbi:MAG: transcriptional regulator [Desulfobacterales bacterium]|nr:transcriptional regulator [Desulfobacterales bacterium]